MSGGPLPTPRDYAGVHDVNAFYSRCGRVAGLDLSAVWLPGTMTRPWCSCR